MLAPGAARARHEIAERTSPPIRARSRRCGRRGRAGPGRRAADRGQQDAWTSTAIRAAIEAGITRSGRELRAGAPGRRRRASATGRPLALHRGAADRAPRTTSPISPTSCRRRGPEHAARRLAGRAARAGRSLDALDRGRLHGARARVSRRTTCATAAELVATLDGPPAPRTDDDRAADDDARGGAAVVPAPPRAPRRLCRRAIPDVLDLSMGMSLDYDVAVEEGATMVRIGTAVFGPAVSGRDGVSRRKRGWPACGRRR